MAASPTSTSPTVTNPKPPSEGGSQWKICEVNLTCVDDAYFQFIGPFGKAEYLCQKCAQAEIAAILASGNKEHAKKLKAGLLKL